MKLIPGIGTVMGGLVNGTAAAAFTVALGEAYIVIMTMIAKGEIRREDISQQQFIEQMKDIFMDKLTHTRIPMKD